MKKSASFITSLFFCIAILLVNGLAFSAEIPTPPFGDTGWELVFQDEFEGQSLDTSKWSYNYPWGNTHNHRAYMTPENVSVSNGVLRIKGENRRHPDAPDGVEQGGEWYSLDYTAGAVNTKSSFNFTAGYIEGRFKVPSSKGFWPAFWTLNANTGWPPEIDILEVLCHAPNELHTNYHYGPSWDNKWSHYQTFNVENLSQGFHTYAVEWTPDYMKWYLDGRQLGSAFTDTEWIEQAEDMYILINLALGGWEDDPDSTTVWPGYYECDWVRIWQKDNYDGIQAFANSGFETGYLTPWYAWNDVNIVDNNQRSGNYALRVGDAPASAEQKIAVEPNTTYTFSGFGKVPSGQEILIGVKNYGGSQITTPIRSTDYSKETITFTTGANNTSATIFFYRDQGTGYSYGDDFKVEIKEPEIIMGDLDDDGAINSIDLTLLTRYVLGNISHFPSENGLISADLNQDNLINSMDYALLRRYILGHIIGF